MVVCGLAGGRVALPLPAVGGGRALLCGRRTPGWLPGGRSRRLGWRGGLAGLVFLLDGRVHLVHGRLQGCGRVLIVPGLVAFDAAGLADGLLQAVADGVVRHFPVGVA